MVYHSTYIIQQYISQLNENEACSCKIKCIINCSKKINDKDSEFKISDIVRISKYKNILQKAMIRIGLRRFF